MSKYAPGPLEVGVGTVGGREHIVVTKAGSTHTAVALCGYFGADDEAESVAFATLFAAAPELLEALQDTVAALVRGDVVKDTQAICKARAAIARATGEGK